MKIQAPQLFKRLLLAGGTCLFALGAGGAHAAVTFEGINFSGLPGLTGPGSPAFGQSVMVKFKHGATGSTLSATYHNGEHISKLIAPDNLWNISNTAYSLNASFNSAGVFTGGSMSISGRIKGLGINTTQTLMTADLTKFAKNFSGSFYGFNTANIVCNPAVDAAVGCTTSESVYFGLHKAQKSMTKSWSTKAISYATVPVPAAIWLLGSGLLGLAGYARRVRNTTR